jgi:hypothetical protein
MLISIFLHTIFWRAQKKCCMEGGGGENYPFHLASNLNSKIIVDLLGHRYLMLAPSLFQTHTHFFFVFHSFMIDWIYLKSICCLINQILGWHKAEQGG